MNELMQRRQICICLCVPHLLLRVLQNSNVHFVHENKGVYLNKGGRWHLLVHPLAQASLQVHMCQVLESCWLLLQAYAIPSFQFDIKLYRTNRPPHSAVRAPGKFQSPLIMEHIIEHVAARLDMDPVRVRETNFMKAPAPGTYHNLFRRSLSFRFVSAILHCIALHCIASHSAFC